MHPILHDRLAELRRQDLHAERARDRLAARAATAPFALDRRALTVVAAVVALVGGLLLGTDGAEVGVSIAHGR